MGFGDLLIFFFLECLVFFIINFKLILKYLCGFPSYFELVTIVNLFLSLVLPRLA